MKRRNAQQQHDQHPCPSPLPNPQSSSSLLKDISNFKTPKRPLQNPNLHSPYVQFFTASKQTPCPSSSSACHSLSFRRPSVVKSKFRSNAARKLKAFELEQSQLSRKAQIQKENSLKSLSNSLTVWLNFLFENPKAFVCDPSKLLSEDHVQDWENDLSDNGKRVCGPASLVVVDRRWRSPKRQRNCWWSVENVDESAFQNSKMFSTLHDSLHEVCSFEDLKQRMRAYLSLSSCREIFNVMTQVAKNIDEGRIKMKAHCPIVTDVGMKEKATKILMGYSPVWLRIGLYIVFGGDSLLSSEDVNLDQETRFLKMIVVQQFFSHPGLAKAYAYNKKVEGLYRPGYFEAMGNVILKRFLLLVLVLDRAKSQCSLPLKHGIDGMDGGSPMLFTIQSNIKSSRQVINDFLSSDLMHGEGNVLAHLVNLGYIVPYQQNPLIEYDFRVTDLFKDLQDGIRLCRAIQLLQRDSSILMKLVVPSDSRKKNLVNCSIALQYLNDAGVPLHDEDNMTIEEEDIAQGDKELMVSLLWNMFVHLQLPLLINKSLLLKEISRIHGVEEDALDYHGYSHLEVLLKWIQGICEIYDIKIDNFTSLVDGKAMWCLLDYYYRKDLHCSCSYEDPNGRSSMESIVSATAYTDAVHNFILSQKLVTLLGNFPEVLQISDILEHNGPCNERSVVILLVFLSSELFVRKNMDQLNFHKFLGCACQSLEKKFSSTRQSSLTSTTARPQEDTEGPSEDALRKFKAIQAWWRDMAERNNKYDTKSATSSTLQSSLTEKESAAMVIQSYFRQSLEYKKYRKIKRAVSVLQSAIQLWLLMKSKSDTNVSNPFISEEMQHVCGEQSEFRSYVLTLVDMHGFVKLKSSVLLIQQAARAWINRKLLGGGILVHAISSPNLFNAVISSQVLEHGSTPKTTHTYTDAQRDSNSLLSSENELIESKTNAVEKIQFAWKRHALCCNKHLKATMIQSYFRGWLSRKSFWNKKQAITTIQRRYKKMQHARALQYNSVIKSAIVIQSHVRRWFIQREALRQKHLIVVIQSHCRAWLMRRSLLHQREAATKIQSAQRCHLCRKDFRCTQYAAIQVQRFVRGQITRRKLLGASRFPASVLKLQRWWKNILVLRSKNKSVIIIQSHIRMFIVQREATRKRHHIVILQSYWRAYLVRKETKGQLHDLRLRVQKSATNVDDSMRLINRHLVALSELLSMKSVSGILHTCATLDFATKHSQKCCEKLVEADAVDTLLTLIRSVSQSIPDQQVLRHALSTLRNLARYPHLLEVVINSNRSIETIFWVLLRNKEEGYFVASELLKKICSNRNGVKAARSFPALIKRLHSLVEDLTRKISYEKRKGRVPVTKEITERRLREAAELLKLTMG